MAGKKPEHYGESYKLGEIALVYIFEESDESKHLLADLLGRSEQAIDFIYRWISGGNFPKGSHNAIKRQVALVQSKLGPGLHGALPSLLIQK